MSPTLISFIDTALQKMSDNELRKMWKAIYGKHAPQFNKEVYIQHISSRLANLDFPIGSAYITKWLSDVYRLHYEITNNTKSSITGSKSLIEIADSLARTIRQEKRRL